MGRVEGKVAVVTGAASSIGLGFAVARMLVREGARVALTDINDGGVQSRAAELGAAAHGIAHDVTREEDWARIIETATERFGRVDILVNNAGSAMLGPLGDMTKATWDRQINVNLSSVFLGCKAVLPEFRRLGGGVIVNISSIAGLFGTRNGTAYSASKAGVHLFSKSLALELAAENIRVNSIHPGIIATEMMQVGERDMGDVQARMAAAIPLGRLGEADDIGAMALFLASDEAKYITGSEFVVDGGFTAQ